ncbi:MAG: hypothetical protein HW401_508, partial [Parcubacteria group bacterium]|nr:hypothetical protein [Parcubacteria group bacterium]
MKFYFIDPHSSRSISDNYKRFIDLTSTYTQAEKDFYNKYMAWKSNDAFPNNMATGYPSGSTFSVVWDWQQQAVIDKVVEGIIAMAHKYEAAAGDPGYPFTFAGTADDTGALTGEFALAGVAQVSLAYWTGSDSSLLHSGITHEYATYSDGRAAYFKKLRQRMKEEFPNAKFILEPARIYHANWIEELVRHIKDRVDKNELVPDMISQEGAQETGVEFVDDVNIFNSGLNITKDIVGSSQSNQVSESKNRLIAAKAGINGAWYNWFGRWGGAGDLPNFQSITEVYPRLKLIRLIPNWDNLRNIPLSQRTWNNSTTDPIYSSKKNTTDPNPTSYFDSHVMYSR